ncbi:MAG: hypothetical protein ACQKBV_10055 [Puniceicoccales bacterium]
MGDQPEYIQPSNEELIAQNEWNEEEDVLTFLIQAYLSQFDRTPKNLEVLVMYGETIGLEYTFKDITRFELTERENEIDVNSFGRNDKFRGITTTIPIPVHKKHLLRNEQ